MEDEERRNLPWGLVDGSISVSGSMLLAVLINSCQSCNGIWLVGFFKELSDKNAGMIVVATLLLFPTAIVIFGGVNLFFAAKEAFERRQRRLRAAAQQAGLEQGLEQGRQEERERIGQALERRGIATTPEIAVSLNHCMLGVILGCAPDAPFSQDDINQSLGVELWYWQDSSLNPARYSTPAATELR